MHQFEKINRKLLGSQTEEALMNYILEESIAIGQKIPNEFELADKFGVGRSTIREAVKSLVSKGILEVKRGSGTYVISTNTLYDDPLGLSKLEDKYKLALELSNVRLMLEPEIAALTAKNASKEEIKQIEHLCNEVERLYLSGKNHIHKDIEFHNCIAKGSQNRVIESLMPIIHTAVMTFANMTSYTLKKETVETHRAITNAIKDRDAVGAKCAMMMHLTYNRQMILKLLKKSYHQKKAKAQ